MRSTQMMLVALAALSAPLIAAGDDTDRSIDVKDCNRPNQIKIRFTEGVRGKKGADAAPWVDGIPLSDQDLQPRALALNATLEQRQIRKLDARAMTEAQCKEVEKFEATKGLIVFPEGPRDFTVESVTTGETASVSALQNQTIGGGSVLHILTCQCTLYGRVVEHSNPNVINDVRFTMGADKSGRLTLDPCGCVGPRPGQLRGAQTDVMGMRVVCHLGGKIGVPLMCPKGDSSTGAICPPE